MSRPGDRLRAFAADWCCPDTMQRLIDPVIADIQKEHAEALRQGKPWKSRWIAFAGYATFAKVIVAAGLTGALSPRLWTRDDRSALARTIGWSCGIVAAMTLLNCYLAWHSVNVALRGEAGIRLVLLRVPQALSLSIPVALTLGLAAALGGRIISRHTRFRLATLAIACSVMVFCDLAWAVPAANQSFRIRTSRLFAQQRGDVEHWSAPPPGPSEWTLGDYRRELQRERNSSLLPYTSLPWPRFGRDRELEYSYYFRWLFPTASIVLALVILSLVGQRPMRRWLLVGIAFAALFGFYVLMFLARALAVGRELLPIVLAVWSPNVIFLLISIALMLDARRRPDHRPASS